jgi:hypothetical protein
MTYRTAGLVLALALLVPTVALAANTGPVHALEGLIGPKYNGAPSQMLAGTMGLTFDELHDDLDQPFTGKVDDPKPLKKLGYDVAKGDGVELKRVGDHEWRLKLLGTKKEMTLRVVS